MLWLMPDPTGPLTTWDAEPESLFSWRFSVREQGHEITSLVPSWILDRATFAWQGQTCRIGAQSLLHTGYVLSADGRTVATAERPTPFHRGFTIRSDGLTLLLRPRRLFSRGFTVTDASGREVGAIMPAGWFTRRCRLEFALEVPPPLRLFMLALVLFLRRRQRSAR